tara:strand:- start:8808 stop:10745 length:1938 start_codon:yes stop_codon:yes gene_type:complete
MAFQLSPGVLVQEKDLTNVVPAVATTIGGIVGDFQWGPAHEIISVQSENNLVERFGKPTLSIFYDHMVASSFLSYGSNLLTVREVGAAARNAVSTGTAVQIKNLEQYQESYSNGEGSVGPWAAKYPGTRGNALQVEIADIASASGLSVGSATVTAGGSGYTSATVTFADPTGITPAQGGITATGTATISGGAVSAITITHPGYGYSSAPAVTIGGDGSSATATSTLQTAWTYASQFDFTPTTTTWAKNNGASRDMVHVIVIDETGEITGTAGTVLEKFAGLSKASDAKDDINQTNFYKNVINDRSEWIYWMDHPTNGSNWGTSSAGGTVFACLNGSSDSDVSTSLASGVDASPANSDLQAGYQLFANDELVDVSLILTSAHPTAVGDYVIDNVAEIRKDAMVFISPQRSAVVNNEGSESTSIITTSDLNAYTRSSYAVYDSGWKYMYDKYNDRYVYVPLNGDVAGTCVVTDKSDDPWFSPGGLNRGQIKNAIKLAWSPTKAQRDTLYAKGVNPVISTPGSGIVLFGDKTMLDSPSAFNRINVRRLFIVLEKAIATAAKFQLFEFNDAFTRAQFVALVEPFLRDVQGRRGIFDFRVVCDETNNTPQVIDANEFKADIFVKPAKSINFITLTFVATRSGISFEELGG